MKPFNDRVDELVSRLLTAAGMLPADVRAAIFADAARRGGAARPGGEVPPALAPLTAAIAQNPNGITDGDYRALEAAGYSEDQLFEVTLAAATGAAWARLDRGLAALGRGRR